MRHLAKMETRTDEVSQTEAELSLGSDKVRRDSLSKYDQQYPAPLDPKQISLASAYCSLWAELVDKKEHTIMQSYGGPQHENPSAASMKLVQVARDKFMRSIVTNANFQTTKPPDDIPLHMDNEKSTSRTENRKRSSSLDNSFAQSRKIGELAPQWNGEIQDLVIEEPGPAWGATKGWFKKTFAPKKPDQTDNKTEFSYVVFSIRVLKFYCDTFENANCVLHWLPGYNITNQSHWTQMKPKATLSKSTKSA